MRGKRSKQYRKLMKQFALTFHFREPYQVLVDAQMIQDADRFAMDLVKGLERTLHGKVKPMITQCSIRHLYKLPTTDIPASRKDTLISRAKDMERRRCNHHTLDEPLSTRDCFSDVIDPKGSQTNKNRYIVASQEEAVRTFCRTIKGVPLLYVKRSVMVMEPMAESSQGVQSGLEREKMRSGIAKTETESKGSKRKRGEEASGGEKTGLADEDDPNLPSIKKKRKTRGPKEPNPLSVKKPRQLRELRTDPGRASRMIVEEAAQIEGPSVSEPREGETGSRERPMLEDFDTTSKRKRRRKHKPGGVDNLGLDLRTHAAAESR